MESNPKLKCSNKYCQVDLEENTSYCDDCNKLSLEKKSQERWITISAIALGLSWVFVFVALATDLLGISERISLFGRLGAVVTMIAVICEFNLNRKLTPVYPFHIKSGLSFGRVGEAIEISIPSQIDNKLSSFFMVSLVAGTLIWGFGDLINEPIFRALFK